MTINFDRKRLRMAQKEDNWAQQKELLERQQKISEEQALFKPKKLSTSKLLIWFLFINCTLVELFTGFVTLWEMVISSQTFTMPDFTPLVTLISAVVGEAIGFAIYSIKSAKENCRDGIVFETTMQEYLATMPNPNAADNDTTDEEIKE